MAKARSPEPIITQAAILSMAGRHIQSEIIKLRKESDDLVKKLEAVGQQVESDRFHKMINIQLLYHMERLKAVETMYHIETGTELGYIDEITNDEE